MTSTFWHDRVRPVLAHWGRRLLEWRGLELFRRRDGFHYVPEIYGNKSEKLVDVRELPAFGPAAAEVVAAGRTYLDHGRLYTLWQACANAPAGHIAELGVYQGGSGHFLALAARHFGGDSEIHLFDTFSHFPDVRPEIDVTDRSGQLPLSADAVRDYLSAFPAVRIHAGVFPETAGAVEDLTFSVVHLDSDTYSSYVAAFGFFVPRLMTGGWIVLDDYGFTTCPGATRATDEFLEGTDDFHFVHLLTGQAVLIKK